MLYMLNRRRGLFGFCALIFLTGANLLAQTQDETFAADSFRIRDPYLLADESTGTYYLYAQSKNRAKSGYFGVEVYTSRDLEQWSGPTSVLRLPDSMKVRFVWAPEVHRFNGAYYLFVTLTFDETVSTPAPIAEDWPPMYRRGTWCYRSASPTGPFEPINDGPLTPADAMALDGTFWVEEGVPYMIYCHEWVQIVDGAIDCVRLRSDLSAAEGDAVTILKASSAPNAITDPNVGKVTDGPFLYKSEKSGALLMIWSTILPSRGGYSVLVTRSESGKLAGPWSESTELFTDDGGHGMIFRDFNGRLRLALHQPNGGAGKERLRLFELIDDRALRLAE